MLGSGFPCHPKSEVQPRSAPQAMCWVMAGSPFVLSTLGPHPGRQQPCFPTGPRYSFVVQWGSRWTRAWELPYGLWRMRIFIARGKEGDTVPRWHPTGQSSSCILQANKWRHQTEGNMNDAGTEPGAWTQAVSSLGSLIHCHRSRSWSLAKDTVLWAAGKGDVSSRPSRERMARLQTQHYPRISDSTWALNIPASLSSDETPAFLCPGNSPPRRAPRPSLGRALHFLASMVFDGFSPTLSAAICCSLLSPHRVQFH